jgi:hypothetical protein
MNFWWLRYFPTKYIWDPRLSFTGVTILGYNAETGVPSALSPDTLRGSCGAARSALPTMLRANAQHT